MVVLFAVILSRFQPLRGARPGGFQTTFPSGTAHLLRPRPPLRALLGVSRSDQIKEKKIPACRNCCRPRLINQTREIADEGLDLGDTAVIYYFYAHPSLKPSSLPASPPIACYAVRPGGD